MTSPDVRPYVDLTLFDASSQTIYQKALNYVRIALPEYQPQEGTIESVLLQAMALEVQESIFSINRLPGAITQVLLRLLNVQRNTGTSATTTVRFTGQTTGSFTVPVGTRLLYQPTVSSNPLIVQTTAAVTGTQAKAIAAISQTLTTITVTTQTRHGLGVGNLVTITGTGVTALNVVNSAVVSVDTTGLVFTLTSTTGTFSATTGTVTPAATIPATAFVPAQTAALTGDFNGLAAGTSLNLLSVLPAVASTTLETALLGGASTETDSQYFGRAVATLGRLSAALVTTGQIEQYVAGSGRFPDVYRVHAANNTSPGRAGGFSSRVLIACAAIDGNSANLLTGVGDGSVTPTNVNYGVLDTVYDGIAEMAYSGLAVNVTHPAFVTLTVTAATKLPTGLTATVVQAALTQTLNSYLSPNTWAWGTSVRVNELVVQLRNTMVTVGTSTYSAADYVTSVSILPTDAYVPATSTYNRFVTAQRARTTNVATITTAAAHGMTIAGGETLYIKVSGMADTSFNTAGLVPALSASGSTFTYANTGANVVTTADAGGAVISICKVTTATGDVTILDPAPLVVSGAHSVTAS